MDLSKIEVTYEELFELLNLDKCAYNNTQKVTEEVFVETPNGFTNILAGVVKPELDMLNIRFSDNSEVNVADKHIFSINGNEIFAKDAVEVDARNGKLKIISKKNIGKFDGFDINIESPHWYYSTNEVIYHNTLLMDDLISGHILDKKNVLLVSMEMEDREIMKRVHANALDLPINDLKNLDPLVIRKAHERVQSQGIGKFYVKDFPNGSFSPLMLDALLDNYKNEIGIEFDIVYLDYLGIMKSDLISPSAGLYSYVKSIVEETRSIAKKRKIPIVSASQLNRCISPNSLIETKEGLKRAKDIKCNDEVKSNNGYNTVISVSDIEKQKMYKIKTKSGKEIICSGEHKFPTPHGPMSIHIGLKIGEKLSTKS